MGLRASEMAFVAAFVLAKAVVITLVVWLAIRAVGRGRRAGPPEALSSTTRERLDERLARGEIDEQEYLRLLEALYSRR